MSDSSTWPWEVYYKETQPRWETGLGFGRLDKELTCGGTSLDEGMALEWVIIHRIGLALVDRGVIKKCKGGKLLVHSKRRRGAKWGDEPVEYTLEKGALVRLPSSSNG